MNVFYRVFDDDYDSTILDIFEKDLKKIYTIL